MPSPLAQPPSKIVGVHLNYRSRAAERGRMPAHASFFLKPPSSLAGDGDRVVRPRGCELLAYEGELAVVIGARAHGVAPADALACVAGYAAANDFGVYDLRWADRGSNVLSKGHDGFTPLGPRVVDAAALDPAALTLRTRVNGVVVQEDSTANMLFGVAELIADLARMVTLEPGDVILTGTPANSRPVQPGDVVEVEIDGIGVLRNEIAEAERELARYGALPKARPEDRAAAWGSDTPADAPSPAGGPATDAGRRAAGDGDPRDGAAHDATGDGDPSAAAAPDATGAGPTAPRPITLSDAAERALRTVSTATLTVQLRRRGIANTFIAGLRPTRPDLRLLGYAHTLRYVPLREDVRDADTAPLNAQKRAIESIAPGDVLVIDARGDAGAGTLGDILATRALRRGAAGIVTDGGLRDSPAIAALDIPAYYQAPHAAVFGLIHHPLEANVPIACGGVLVMPGDVIVGDAEGALVLPAALAEEVARDALEQEQREAWALERVGAGESIRGVYPLAEERRAEYEAWRATKEAATGEEPA